MLNGGMDDALWSRLSDAARAEVDRLISLNRNVQAVALMREDAGPPTPGIHTCVELLVRRSAELGRPLA